MPQRSQTWSQTESQIWSQTRSRIWLIVWNCRRSGHTTIPKIAPSAKVLSVDAQHFLSTPPSAQIFFHTFLHFLKGTGGEKKMEIEMLVFNCPPFRPGSYAPGRQDGNGHVLSPIRAGSCAPAVVAIAKQTLPLCLGHRPRRTRAGKKWK